MKYVVHLFFEELKALERGKANQGHASYTSRVGALVRGNRHLKIEVSHGLQTAV